MPATSSAIGPPSDRDALLEAERSGPVEPAALQPPVEEVVVVVARDDDDPAIPERTAELVEERAGRLDRRLQRKVAKLDGVAQQHDLVRFRERPPEGLAELRPPQQVDPTARAEVQIGEDDGPGHRHILARGPGGRVHPYRLAVAMSVGPATEAPTQAAGIPVMNPATGELIATVPELGTEEVRGMVAVAREAQPTWAAIGFEGRAEVLLAARNWMATNAERVVTTIVGETGRPVDETQFAELSYGLSSLEFWAKTAGTYLADEEVDSASPFVRGRRLIVRYAPIGVVGVIGPWNYPLNNSFGDCIPALAAGNAVVLKPSEVTPLTSLLMARMLAECELPPGVFQVATGPRRDGSRAGRRGGHGHVHGSVETGKKVMARAAATLTPVSLELGGKDPMIVLADADLERAANAAVATA